LLSDIEYKFFALIKDIEDISINLNLKNLSDNDFFNIVLDSSKKYIEIKVKSELNRHKNIQVITRLSIFNWKDKYQFIDSIRKININNEILDIKIKLMAQGQGVFIDYDEEKEGVACVVDIGYNTFDFLVFNNSKSNPSLSFATKKVQIQ